MNTVRLMVEVNMRILDGDPLASRRCNSSCVNLLASNRDGPLIDRSRIPGLDGREIGLARLVSGASAPAMRLKKICRRGQRIGRNVEISANAIVQDVLGQELGVAHLTVHGAARACREDSAIHQCQSCVELFSEICCPTAVMGESGYSRQNVLIPARPPKARLHSPNGQERPRRDAEALLDGRE
jgi:hypothetical protein